MSSKLSVRHVFKVFGAAAGEALARLRQGQGKEQILRETGATVGVQDTSFDVSEGEIFVVMGLSGSGKSTLVRMLNGLIPPTAGEICIDGEDVASCTPDRLRAIRRVGRRRRWSDNRGSVLGLDRRCRHQVDQHLRGLGRGDGGD